MTEKEIKAIIDKYDLVRRGDKIGTYKTSIDKAAFAREVGGNKPEIMAYFLAQEEAARKLRENREATFEAIPGVAELRKARWQLAESKRRLDEMMETGSSVLFDVDHPTIEEYQALEEKYPMAIFALEAERRAFETENLELGII